MFQVLLIAQLQSNPCQGLPNQPNTTAKVCQKTITRNAKNQFVYKMITTADPTRQITVNRCTWKASVVGGYYTYEDDNKWCSRD